MKTLIIASATTVLALALPALIYAETVGVFFDPSVEQVKFAAGDVKTALEGKHFTVEMLPLTDLKASYSNKKVVVALATDQAVASQLAVQGGKPASRSSGACLRSPLREQMPPGPG